MSRDSGARLTLAPLVLALLAGPAISARAQTKPTRTSVVVDSNPALFAVLAGLNAAGYDNGLSAADPIREQVRKALAAESPDQVPALKELRDYVAGHRLNNPNQDLARYVTLALFLGNPPGLTLSVPVTGLPPDASSVSDIVPILQRFWQQAHLDRIWEQQQGAMQLTLDQDALTTRKMLDQVNAFFRIPQDYSPRTFFIYPSAMLSAGQSDALNYEDNYYIAVHLNLKDQLPQVRHTYLHFILDPLIARYPAAITPVEQELLPIVAKAPALDIQFKRDPELLYTECLVRAVEIQLDPGTLVQKQAAVAAAMSQGLVLTGLWFNQLTAFRSDPASFTTFYPEAAFALGIDQQIGQFKHIAFAAAPATPSGTTAPGSPAGASAPAMVQPVRAPGLLEQAQARFDAHDLDAASVLAQAELKRSKTSKADDAGAYFLLGKIAAERNQPQAAVDNFQQALAVARAGDTHIRTWSNLFLARLYDASHDRTHAIEHYKQALATADTNASKALAQAGIQAPYEPRAIKH